MSVNGEEYTIGAAASNPSSLILFGNTTETEGRCNFAIRDVTITDGEGDTIYKAATINNSNATGLYDETNADWVGLITY